jgi:AraC-like DNA-binding protein
MMIVQSQKLTHQRKHQTHWHQHDTGQLFCIRRGMMIVQTEQAQWALTPATIGWFPPQLQHCAWTVGDVEGESLQVRGMVLPAAGVWPADPFLMLLMARLAKCDAADLMPQQHLLAVMIDELKRMSPAPLQLILPQDRRARQVAEALLEKPHSTQPQAELANRYGLSVRTLSRLFRAGTGLSFSQWRQQARVLAAMALLLGGKTVSETATQCGYENVSAFIAAFKMRFGITPGQFRARQFGD